MSLKKIKYRGIILSLIIPIIWIGLIYILYGRYASRSVLEIDPQISLTNSNEIIIRQEWRGLYLNGEKIGYSHTILKTGAGYRQGGYEINNEAYLTLNLASTRQQISIKDQSMLNSDLRIRAFQFAIDPGNNPITVIGTLGQKLLRLHIKGADSDNVQSIPITELPVSPEVVNLILLKDKFPIGKKYQLPVFDPNTMNIGHLEVEILGKDSD